MNSEKKIEMNSEKKIEPLYKEIQTFNPIRKGEYQNNLDSIKHLTAEQVNQKLKYQSLNSD
jgi:hypothetical protein